MANEKEKSIKGMRYKMKGRKNRKLSYNPEAVSMSSIQMIAPKELGLVMWPTFPDTESRSCTRGQSGSGTIDGLSGKYP